LWCGILFTSDPPEAGRKHHFNMKKLITVVAFALLTLTFIPAHSEIVAGVVPSSTPAEATAKVLTNRLEEINTMDKSGLKSSEKKALRMEVRTIKKELATNSGGVYLSVGALLLIIILLIVLL
jgi:hypothetical protein